MGRFDNLLPNVALEPDLDQYAADLMSASDLTDEERTALKSVFAKPAFASKVRNSVSLRSQAQSALDRARNAVTQAEGIYDANEQWRVTEEEKLRQIRMGINPDARAAGGGGGAGADASRQPNPEPPKFELPPDVLRQKDLQDFAGLQDRAYLAVISDTAYVINDYPVRFGEPMPPDDYEKLQKYALDNRMPLKQAYSVFIKPKEDAKREKDFAAKLVAAREEGRQEGLSLRGEPSFSEEGADFGTGGDLGWHDDLLGKRRRTQVLDNSGKELSGEDAFVAQWNKTHGFRQKPQAH